MQQKPSKVNIVRHIRPITIYSAPYADNMYGATLFIELDYSERKVKYGYSICVGDNFDRKKGIQFAEERFHFDPAVIDMPENGFEDTSVTAHIIENLVKTKISPRNQNLLMAMWFAG